MVETPTQMSVLYNNVRTLSDYAQQVLASARYIYALDFIKSDIIRR
jgi:hypothetical protein